MATQAQLAAVQQLYVGYLGRAADSAGQQFWANAIANGTATIASVATGFTLSNEYKATYGGLSTSDLVEQVYNNVLSRAPDAAGKAFWVAALASGKVTADTLVATIVTNLGALDQQTINNKVFVAQTYTDTVGANYNAEAGATVLVGVDSTPASVTAALAAISGGTLNGQVPGLALINAVDTAVAAQTSFEAANKAAADALVAKIAAQNKAAGINATTTKTDDIGASSLYSTKITAVVDDAALARKAVTDSTGGDKDTSVLLTRADTAAKAVAADFAVLSSTEKLAANKYVAAIAAEATAKAAAATAVEQGSAIGGLTNDTTATAGLAKLGTPSDATATPPVVGTPATASDVYDRYVAGTADQRAAIVDALKDSTSFAAFKAVADKDAAYADAFKATQNAKDALDSGITASAETVTIHGKVIAVANDSDTVNGTAAANKYVTDLAAKTAADKLVVSAQAADADVASAKALADAFKVQTDAVQTAKVALADFDATGVSLVDLVHTTVVAGTTVNATADVKDVFYFTDKLAATSATPDFKIGSFAAGDSIVLGSGFTFNSGALTTGDNNKQEFFLVKSDAGVQIVLEGANYGSSELTPNTTTGAITSTAADHAQVITLTGVTLDHVSVANGVVSYV